MLPSPTTSPYCILRQIPALMVSLFVKTWRVTWMALSSIATLAIVVLLLLPPKERQVSARPAEQKVSAPFSISPEGDILIPPDSPLSEKLQVVEIQPEEVSFPVLRVTGNTVARLMDGATTAEDRWQFS